MEKFAQHLRSSTATKEIFLGMVLGFTDSVAAVRVETVMVSTNLHHHVMRSDINSQLLGIPSP